MKLEEWKTRSRNNRNYAHFDNKVSLKNVWNYINNPNNIQTHSFYPFISYTKTFRKYSNNKGIQIKERKLCYSAHIDRYIFQYYGYKLNQLYNIRAERDNINYCAIAYRDNLHKNNIHFAKKAIDFIREKENCNIIVGDFTKFFDSLDHGYLKDMLCELLNVKVLPTDYYAVYKNITKFSTWDMTSILELNGLPNSIVGLEELNKLDRALSFELFKKYKKGNVIKNVDNFGIPQGSAISAILSNIYMLELDNHLNDYVSDANGLYMRYSDDFIIILPSERDNVFKKQFDYINHLIKSIPRLDLQPDKTQIFKFDNGVLISNNEFVLENVENSKNLLNYLGFTFDGKIVAIRDKTISKYYYRMYRKLKTIIKNNGRTKNDKKISCKNLYDKYSIKGAYFGKGNFISYVLRSEAVFGRGEAINRGTKNHMQKIRKGLNNM